MLYDNRLQAREAGYSAHYVKNEGGGGEEAPSSSGFTPKSWQEYLDVASAKGACVIA
jgi:hypothetical protein